MQKRDTCVYNTSHANNANQALDRIINFFPETRHIQLLQDLSLNIRGIISQRLIPTEDGKCAAAIEILLSSPRTADLIAKGNVHELKELMEKSAEQGMQTFDMALYKLYKAGTITLEEALKNADSRNNLRLRITLDSKNKKDKPEEAAAAPEPEEVEVEAAPEPEPEPASARGLEGLSLVDLDDQES